MTTGSEQVNGARQWLRGLEVFARPLPEFDPEEAPDDPVRLFLSWLVEAVADGVRDPHAMTLSTVDSAGDPDARVLILKGVGPEGWQFAGHAFSPKGGQLACHPRAALTFYWPEHGRQVRIRGPVTPGSGEVNAADFLDRSPTARAESLLGRQSQYLMDPAERDHALEKALAMIEREPSLVDSAWTLYTLAPAEVEFWQAAKDRVHTRLRYERTAAGWERLRLWS
ncbi:pyridoxal 5'-phosphate synthase [Streptomyces sp. Isolate_45]|uniref:pyridoxine/pyridoxamine 5'-phosphate oxidase n=1 Tax=Streptomyces sp. Isolate_45 TaxID=2950111 RepID=UPI002481D208|nr:pyridoxal 5'-phosphate synthase [Streptomyces sp. Isolate_45]MDA5280888.1 pyridoxal 5'-phosphate synthase [Streptomyces sp. Isolate_45]